MKCTIGGKSSEAGHPSANIRSCSGKTTKTSNRMELLPSRVCYSVRHVVTGTGNTFCAMLMKTTTTKKDKNIKESNYLQINLLQWNPAMKDQFSFQVIFFRNLSLPSLCLSVCLFVCLSLSLCVSLSVYILIVTNSSSFKATLAWFLLLLLSYGFKVVAIEKTCICTARCLTFRPKQLAQ